MRFQNLKKNLAKVEHFSKDYEETLQSEFKMDKSSLDLVLDLLDYNPDTGIFTHKRTTSGAKKGEIAGGKHKSGYIVVCLNQRHELAHRVAFLIMTGKYPIGHIDHINGNREDNRWNNLREASRCENQANAKIRIDNSSGVKGVTKDKYSDRWIARLQRNGVRICVGYFNTIEEAADALKAARLISHKGFVNNG